MASLQHGSVMRTPLKCVSFYKSEDQSSCEMLKIQTEKLLMTQPVARKHMRDQFKVNVLAVEYPGAFLWEAFRRLDLAKQCGKGQHSQRS